MSWNVACSKPSAMMQAFVRFGTQLYPLLLTSFALGCAADPASTGDDDPSDPLPDAAEPDVVPPAPAAGSLDESFGDHGVLPLAFGTSYAGAIAVQGDKLLVCTTHLDPTGTSARIYRLDASGAIDTTFGTEGRLTIVAANGTACRDVIATAGDIMIAYRDVGANTVQTARRGPNGGSISAVNALNVSSHLSHAEGSEDVVIGSVYLGKAMILRLTQSTSLNSGGLLESDQLVAAFADVDGKRSGVGKFASQAAESWQVLRETTSGSFSTLGVGARAAAGTAIGDLLHDAVRLPDGSYFAVGGMDSDAEVMAARFVDGVSPTVDVEHHRVAGGASMAQAITLDGAERPVVVGAAAIAGSTRFAWQRYQAQSVTLDASYQDGGIAYMSAPSGSGELVDIVRFNGALYALGHYDVETAEPKVALLKIVE